MGYEYKLLAEEQVFGPERLDVIALCGAVCRASDFAVLTGAGTDEEGSCEWFLSSAAGYGDACVVDMKGERKAVYATAYGNVRPVIACDDISDMDCRLFKDISGATEVEFGEYPQAAADKKTSNALEEAFSIGSMIKTGKKYSAAYEELQYEEKKYIRIAYAAGEKCRLSNGKTYMNGEIAWVKVEPVIWLYDERAGVMISREVLVSGQIYSADSFYDGDFSKTALCSFLSGSLAGDIIPSVVRQLTEEEKKRHEEQMKRAARRRNPYGLTFGEVSEEDIIRGAIESDVAVFLHGASSEGKSARVKQIDPTCEIIYLRNATPDSLNGRSVYNQSTGEMIDIRPAWLKKLRKKCEEEPDKPHVVFFDEINNALPSIQGMAFNIVLDREVNGIWKLPDNARIVAAGNDMEDSLAAHQLAQPFFNRFAHVYINTTTDKWLKWARRSRIHPAIYAYIAFKRGETLRSPYDGKKPNADPRKWEMASKMLYATGQPEMLRSLLGEEITDEFVKFCSQAVITVEDVIKGDYSEEEISNMNTSERYATTVGLSLAEDENRDAIREFVSKLGEEFLRLLDSFTAAEE